MCLSNSIQPRNQTNLWPNTFQGLCQPFKAQPLCATCVVASHWIGSARWLLCIYRLDESLWNCLVSLTRGDRHSRMLRWPLLECVNCGSGLKGRWEHRQRSQSTAAWFRRAQSVLQSVTWSKRQYVEGIDRARRSLQAKGQVTRNVWYSELKCSLLFGVQRKDTTLPLRGTFPSSL